LEIFGFIYLVRNRINGKIYVGQTVTTVSKRWDKHKFKSRLTNKTKSYFHDAIAKHGEDNFDVVELHRAYSEDELNEMEIRAIWACGSLDRKVGYNLKRGGEGGPIPEETKKKIGRANRGRKYTEEQKANRGTLSKAQWADPAYRERVNIAYAKRCKSPEYIAKHPALLTKKPRTGKTLSDLMKERWKDEEFQAMRSRKQKELWQDPEARARIMAAKQGQVAVNKGIKTGKPAWNAGKKATEEQLAKMREASAKRWANPEARRQASETTKRINAERYALAAKDK